MKKILKSTACAVLLPLLVFSACQESKTEQTDSLFVELTDTKVERFDSLELELEKGVSNVVWESSNQSVAVIEDGTVCALNAGTTVISATKGNKVQQQTITVFDEGDKPTIDVEYFPLMRGYEYQTDTQAFFNGKELKDVSFSYSVADTSIASVENGVFTGVSNGETVVTISLSWKNQTNVVSKEVPCRVFSNSAFYTDKAEYLLYTMNSVLGETFETEKKIQPTVYYENEKIDGLTFEWTSGDENVVTVDEEGTLRAVSVGETYVVGTCTYQGETLSTREVPVKIAPPHLITRLDFPFQVGDKNAVFDAKKALGEGYSIGKVVNVATGLAYTYTENGADLSSYAAGDYVFNVYEENEAFSTQVNVIIGDCLVVDAESLKVATGMQNAYIVLGKDLTIDSFTTAVNDPNHLSSGTFNGLGHTIRVKYKSRGLYSYVNDFTFKNLSIICTAATSCSGALFYNARGTVVVENCYLETTLLSNAETVAGIGDILYKQANLSLINTIVKVNGLNQNESVQKNCGGVLSRVWTDRVYYTNSYVIANGTLISNNKPNEYTVTMNQQKGVLFETETAFANAKEDGLIVLDDYNHYWDVSSIVPKFTSEE